METSVDHFLKIGSTHEVCQDYVISGTDPVPHVILADGCSSSEESDIGARLLAHSARVWLRLAGPHAGAGDYARIESAIVTHANGIAGPLGLSPSALDATLVLAYLSEDRVVVHVFGDGFVALADTGGGCRVIDISFPGNAPYYPSYRLDPGRDHAYRSQYYSKTVGMRILPPDGPVSFAFPVTDYPVILVASDGLDSFVDMSGGKIGPDAVARRFSQFKSLKGSFLKRRIKRAVRDFEKDGISHYDDLSVGAFLTTRSQGAIAGDNSGRIRQGANSGDK